MKVVKRGRKRRRENKTVQVELSCTACESLLSAELQVVKGELQADTDHQLHELRKRVSNNYSLLLSYNKQSFYSH